MIWPTDQSAICCRAAFTDPERLRPTKTRQSLTEDAAGHFANLAHACASVAMTPKTLRISSTG